jgi:O-antigen ligase
VKSQEQSIDVLFKIRLYLLFFLFALCLIGGGGSRTDIISLPYVLPGAAIVLTSVIAVPRPIDLRTVRVPLILLASLALVMLVQLVPLPPQVWTRLPGHAPFAEIASAAGITQPWRSISLNPDLTLSSMADLIVPFAALIGFASLSAAQRPRIVGLVLIGILCSAVLAIAQLSSGPNSALYTYEITNRGAAVGLFANRNHQAVLLACAVPLLACWVNLGTHTLSHSLGRWRFFFLVALLLPLTLVTGSRAGLLLLGTSIVATSLVFRAELFAARGSGRNAALLPLVAVGSILATASLSVLLSRAEAWQRLLNVDIEDEDRLGNLGTFAEMVVAYFPFGSGFGSFDPLYRYFEPANQLQPFYLNHAHNDLLELVITGGLGGFLVLIAFVVWLVRRGRTVLGRSSDNPIHACARAGLIVIGILLLSCLVDYPLRTPLLALIMTLSVALVSADRGARA